MLGTQQGRGQSKHPGRDKRGPVKEKGRGNGEQWVKNWKLSGLGHLVWGNQNALLALGEAPHQSTGEQPTLVFVALNDEKKKKRSEASCLLFKECLLVASLSCPFK